MVEHKKDDAPETLPPGDLLRSPDLALNALINEAALQLLNAAEKPSYTAEDIDRWQAEGQRFRECYAELSEAHPPDGTRRFDRNTLLRLQSLFLGEKPALADWGPLKLSERSREIVQKYGILIEGDYLYRPELVQRVIDDHADHFPEVHPLTVDAVMKWLSVQSGSEKDIERGLIVGYPLKAVLEFDLQRRHSVSHITERFLGLRSDSRLLEKGSDEHTFFLNALRRRDDDGNRVTPTADILHFLRAQIVKHREALGIEEDQIADILHWYEFQLEMKSGGDSDYGINWAEHAPFSAESIRKTERLRAAYIVAGLLPGSDDVTLA